MRGGTPVLLLGCFTGKLRPHRKLCGSGGLWIILIRFLGSGALIEPSQPA